MSKAILILDEMPEVCLDCDLCNQEDDTFMSPFCCSVYGIIFKTFEEIKKGKPDWCPLCEMPERRFEEDFDWTELTQKENAAMNHGWNKCLKRLEDEYDE